MLFAPLLSVVKSIVWNLSHAQRAYRIPLQMHIVNYGGLSFMIFLSLLVFTSIFLFLPFEFFDRFEYPKFIAFLILTSLIGIQALKFFSKQHLQKIPKVFFIFVGLFIVGNILSFVFSTDQSLSLIGATYRYQGVFTHILYIVLLFASYIIFSTQSHQETKKFFKNLSYFLLGVSSIALLSYTHIFSLFDPAYFYNRTFATLGNPNYLAVCIIALLPFFFSSVRNRSILIIGGIVSLFSLLLTGTKSAWLAFSLAIFIFAFLYRKNFTSTFAKTGMYTLLAFVILGGTIFFFKPEVVSKFFTERFSSVSTSTRISLWQSGLRMYSSRPLFGYGQDTIEKNIIPYLSKDIRENKDNYVDRVHNELLDIAVTSGALTLIGYLGIFFTILLLTIKRIHFLNYKNNFIISAGISITAIFTFHFFNFSTITSNVIFYILFGYLLSHISNVGYSSTTYLSD